jgi:hypothetical protein
MVIPFGAPEVAHLVHQGLEPVVHGLWPWWGGIRGRDERISGRMRGLVGD